MKAKNLFIVLLAAASLTLIDGLTNLLLGDSSIPSYYPWRYLSNLFVVATMSFYIQHSVFDGRKLWLHVFLILYVIGNFNLQIEAYIFNVTNRAKTLELLLVGVPVSFFASYLLCYFFKPLRKSERVSSVFQSRKLHHWVGRILAANFLYFFFYVIAGMFMQALTPNFEEYYGDKIPPFLTIILTNMFFRGFVFVGIAILIDRTLLLSKIEKALVVGVVFAILGAVAPLIPPSELMPEYIRFAHGIEVGLSNFLYGMTALLIIQSKRITQ